MTEFFQVDAEDIQKKI